jgi:hypothetical protein
MKHAMGLAPTMAQKAKCQMRKPSRIARQHARLTLNVNLCSINQALKNVTCMKNVLKHGLVRMTVVHGRCAALWHQLSSQRNMTKQMKLVMVVQMSGEKKDRSVKHTLWMNASCYAVPIPNAGLSNSKRRPKDVMSTRVASPHDLAQTNAVGRLQD